MLGRKVLQPINLMLNPGGEEERRLPGTYAARHQEAMRTAQENPGKTTAYSTMPERDYDMRLEERKYSVGDAVYRFNRSIVLGQSKKLQPIWSGSWIVTQVISSKDLNLLENWGNTWGMRFNAAKCNIMRVSRTRDPKLFNYSLTGQVLEEVMDAKYLGVTLSNDLEWSKHIAIMTNKANSMLSFMRRNLKGCPEKLKQTAFFYMIRSFMEYGATVWDPYQKYNSD